ncbi:MAG: hypothetical protein ACE148_07920 [Vicinamibacterales bacterium]
MVLIVLAASPVAATFSSCDVQALLVGDDFLGPSMKAKTANDRAVPDGARPAFGLPSTSPARAVGTCRPNRASAILHTPLRI